MSRTRSRPADISLGSELESSKAEVTEAAPLPEKTFTFPNFPRQVYCTLSGIRLRLIQTGEGSGIAYFTFTQTCNSRRSDVATGADWVFTCTLYDAQNAKIRDIYLGAWNHRCGKHFVELRSDFSWVQGLAQSGGLRAARQSQLAIPAESAQLRLICARRRR